MVYGSNDLVDATAFPNPVELDGFGGDATLLAGSADDLLVGGPGANSLIGGAGDDTLVSSGGDDTLVGGTGSAVFQINPGHDPLVIAASGSNALDFSTAAQSITINLGLESGQTQIVDSNNDEVSLEGKFNEYVGSLNGDNVTLNDDSDLVYALAGNSTITAGSGQDSIVGGSGNDIIYATTGDTSITAGSGHDTIVGGSGNDIIYSTTGDTSITAGSGHDTIVGGSGNDIIYATTGDTSITAGSGHDTITGGSGNDIIYSTTGDTSINAGSGHDTITGGSGNDIIYATTGDTSITAGSGHDTITGGSGNDIIYSTTGDTTITAGSGHDTITGGSGNDIIYSTTGDTTITAGSGHDTITGGSGNDIIYSTTGDTTITAGSGHDTITGGSGNDIIYSTTGDTTITAGSGHDTITGGSGNDIIYSTTGDTTITAGSGHDMITGGSGNDIIYGSTGSTTIIGGSGHESFIGGSGDEVIYGGPGNVTIYAGSGNDEIVGGTGNDWIVGGPGTDTITGGTGDDTIVGGTGDATIVGGTGNDSIVGGSGSASIIGGAGNDFIQGGLLSSTITGGSGNDSIIGGNGNDIIYGGTGNDSIVGGYGAESILGGSGNDVLISGNLSSTITGGTGNDLILGGYGNDIIYGGTGDTTIGAGTGQDSIVGGSGNDIIYGGTGESTISGGTGNSTISGGGGDDVLAGSGFDSWLIFYGSTNMTLTDTTFSTSGGSSAPSVSTISGFQNAMLAAGPGDFTLDASGFTGSTILQGGTGNDTLIGSQGPDTLEGGTGNDSLVGGDGGDTFAFNDTSSGSQTIVEPIGSPGSPVAGLDFSQAPAGISINLSQSGPQAVMPATLNDGALTLTLADPLAIDTVLGSGYDDTIIGNVNDNTLIGGGGDDVLVGVGGNNLLEGSVTRTVYLDFNTYELPGQHFYTEAERDAIQAQLTADYSAFSYVFTQTQPQSGPYTPIYFNDPVLVGLEGGIASEIDWRDLDIAGTATLSDNSLVTVPAAFAGVNVNNFLGGPGEPAATSADFIGLSATIAAHELGHLSGLEHGDAFGPIGSGIYSGVDPDLYNPPYPGPIDADQTILDIMASGASVNATLEDAINDPFFGEREAIALAFGESGSPTSEEISTHDSMSTAQPITLSALVVPDTDLEGANADKVFNVTAADVVGYLGETNGASNTDFYSFTAQAGTLINFQLMSAALTRPVAPPGTPPTNENQGPFNTYLVIYNSSGQVIEYNDDSFQDTDSSIIDLTLPTTGTYYAMVTSSPNSVALGQPLTGDYELFMYTFDAGPTAAYPSTTPGLGDTMYAGSGDDTIIAGSADDAIEAHTQDTIVYGSGTANSLAAVASLDVSAGLPQTVDEGTPVTLVGSAVDPTGDATQVYDWHVVAASGQLVADGIGTTFTFTPGNAGSYTVTLTVVNLNVGWDSDTVVITSLDVPPVLTAPSATQSTFAGVTTSIDLGSLATTGIGPFTGTVNWGDGQTSTFSPTSSEDVSLPHVYATAGTYTIDETVSEFFGGSTSATFTVDVAVAETTTTLTSTAASTVYGQTANFTATVSSPAVLTGTVAFYAGAVTPADQIGSGTLSLNNGLYTATFSTSMLPVTGSPYTITAVYGGDASNTASTSNIVNLSITPAPLTITADNQSMTYAGTMPTLTVSYSGLVNGDTPATFTTSPNSPPVVTTVQASTNAGSYAITVNSAYDPNYTITFVPGTLTINKASATIVVTPYSVIDDGNTHTATGTATGVESPNPADLSGLLNLSGTTHTNPGDYTDTWTFAGNANYVSTSGTVTDVVEPPSVSVISFAPVSPNPRNAPVSSIDVTFNEPINVGSLAPGALVLSDDGGANLITSGVTLSLVSGSTYQIGGLTAVTTSEGSYTLTVDAADIENQDGNLGTGTLATSWLMDTTPPTSAVSSLPPETTSTSFTVSVSGSDPTGADGSSPSGIASFEIFTSTDNGPFTFWTSATPAAPAATFTGQAGHTYGFYSIAIDAAGNIQPTPAAAEQTVEILPPLTVSALGTISPNPRNSDVSDLEVTLSLPASAAGFDYQALTLTDNGGANLITSDVNVNAIAVGDTYLLSGLSGLTAAEGDYTLTINGAEITDGYGNPGTGAMSVSWLMDTTAPTSTVNSLPSQTAATSFVVSASGIDPNGTNGSLPSGIATFAIYVAEDGGAYTLLGTVTPADPSTLFTGQVGHTYGFYSVATDNAGNIQPTPASAQQTVQVVAPLSVSSIAPVTPNPRNTALSSIDVNFSEPVNTSSLTSGSVTLTDDGGPNLITSAVTLSIMSGDTYEIGGLTTLTTAQGQYTLTVNTADIQDQNGITGTNSLSTSWLMDTTAPASHVVNSLGTSQTTDTFPVSVTFSDPAGPGAAPASGVSALELWVSVNNGAFSLYQTMNITPAASGTETFPFVGQDRNTYAFHSIAIDAAGNNESKNSNTIEASTSVPDLNPPVTHMLASSPAYSWGPFPSSEFSGLTASSYSNGVFTLNWAGADPDQNSGTPAGTIAVVDIYVEISPSTTPTLIGQLNPGSPNGSGVYSGSLSYDALADGESHNYSFFSVGIDDEQKAQGMPATPDVAFTNVSYSAPLAVENLVVEKGIAERSFIEYLDVDFNQTASTSAALQSLATALKTPGTTNEKYLELLWYGEGTPSAGLPKGSVNLFGAGTTATVTLSGNDLSITFGANGITSLLTETGVSGTGKPTTNFGDGWYALGIDTTGGNGPVFWEPFFRLFGSATGDTTVSGPYSTSGTDAYVVYNAEGETGPLLNADVDGSGAVNSKDLTYTAGAKGDSVGAGIQGSYPAFQLFAGSSAAAPVNATVVTQIEVQALLPAAIDAWQVAGLDAADVRKLESVPIEVANLGTTILGLEAGGVITINQTAAGYDWYVNASTGSSRAFGLVGADGESLAGPGSPAANDVDLVTVLEHELGHVLGLPDNDQAGDLMDITLGLGVRRVPSSLDLDAIVSSSNTAGVLSVGAPVATQQPRSYASTGSVTPATVDAALASMLVPAGGNGDDQDTAAINGSAARSVERISSQNVVHRRKNHVDVPSLRYPSGAWSSRFRSRLINPSIRKDRPE